MDAQSGQYFYRITTGAAAAVAALAALSYFLDAPRGMPVISAAALALADCDLVDRLGRSPRACGPLKIALRPFGAQDSLHDPKSDMGRIIFK